ncbi:hypothetical protein [Cohnella silvisoli]|uniref:Uncharacterized protein n=1 Tax=Cohnella silvisoli TaxID=2873699 RepID=A0ABV1L3P3_9BACL|nr:hypothetical protein [Cohnella silvisoli]MCD9025973.1 hypothetical protein [Cohnella silvisoli]
MLLSWLLLLSSIINGGSPPAAAVPAVVVYSEPVPDQWQLDGIELGDKTGEVTGIWGTPGKIVPDEWQSGCETWHYKEGRNVGFCGGAVSYVEVSAAAKKTNVDGKDIPMVKEELQLMLGKPDFEADDGWGVLRGEEALKVFVDDQGKLVSLDLFTDL